MTEAMGLGRLISARFPLRRTTLREPHLTRSLSGQAVEGAL